MSDAIDTHVKNELGHFLTHCLGSFSFREQGIYNKEDFENEIAKDKDRAFEAINTYYQTVIDRKVQEVVDIACKHMDSQKKRSDFIVEINKETEQ